MDVRVGLWSKLSTKELMLLNCGAGEDSWESLGQQGDQTCQSCSMLSFLPTIPPLWCFLMPTCAHRHSRMFSSVQFIQLCLTLCDPMDCSTPGFPVHHQLPELAKTQVHWVGDAIQPSHPLSPLLLCPQSFAASGSFPMSWLFVSDGQSIRASVLC